MGDGDGDGDGGDGFVRVASAVTGDVLLAACPNDVWGIPMGFP